MSKIKTLHARWLVALAGGFGVMLSDAPVAVACSIPAPPPELRGYPDDGAVGVPTDVLPIYDRTGAFSALIDPYAPDGAMPLEERASLFELVDESGVVIPLVVGDAVGWFIELIPPAELAPRARYTLRTSASQSVGAGLELSFTTGDGPHASPPEPPIAFIEHYTLTSDNPTTCSPWPAGTCISFPEPAPGEYIEEQGFQRGTLSRSSSGYLSNTSRFTDITGINQGTYDCIDLRTRAPNGTFSLPLTLCREDGERYDVRGSENIECTAAGMTQDGRLVSALPPPTAAPSNDEPALDPPTPDAGAPIEPTNVVTTTSDDDTALLSADDTRCTVTGGSGSAPPSAPWYALPLLLLPLRRRRSVG